MTKITQVDRYMQARVADADGLVWFAPADAPLQLDGFHWFSEDKVFRRLPLHPRYPIPEAVDFLAGCTAGGQLRFQTNSGRVVIKAKLRQSSDMFHMPQTGQSGFDLYIGEVGRQRFYGVTNFPYGEVKITCELFRNSTRRLRNFTLNFPLYNGVKEFRLGLEADSRLEAPPAWRQARPIVVYGTSITQGGCAARPGTCYTNILSRRLNQPFLNLGFSGNGKGEPELARIIAEIPDPAMFILDYEANCVDVSTYTRTMPEFIRILRTAQPLVPLLILSKICFGPEALEDEPNDYNLSRSYREDCKTMQIELVDKLRRAGDRHIHFIDGAQLLGHDYDECTVDGIHPTDLGFYRMAAGLAPIIEALLV